MSDQGPIEKTLKIYGYTLGPVVAAFSILSLTEKQFDFSEIARNWIDTFHEISTFLWSWAPFNLHIQIEVFITIVTFFIFPSLSRLYFSTGLPFILDKSSSQFLRVFWSVYFYIIPVVYVLSMIYLAFIANVAIDSSVDGEIISRTVDSLLALIFGGIILSAIVISMRSMRLLYNYLIQLLIIFILLAIFIVLFVQGGLLDSRAM
jgi:hypothetical protein